MNAIRWLLITGLLSGIVDTHSIAPIITEPVEQLQRITEQLASTIDRLPTQTNALMAEQESELQRLQQQLRHTTQEVATIHRCVEHNVPAELSASSSHDASSLSILSTHLQVIVVLFANLYTDSCTLGKSINQCTAATKAALRYLLGATICSYLDQRPKNVQSFGENVDGYRALIAAVAPTGTIAEPGILVAAIQQMHVAAATSILGNIARFIADKSYQEKLNEAELVIRSP
ncbi:hypothetical protein M1466_01130 [Candidatus Dependentiae bacterium]|nr:hypothetical protein [Candidatus Dependentiae bacterium]